MKRMEKKWLQAQIARLEAPAEETLKQKEERLKDVVNDFRRHSQIFILTVHQSFCNNHFYKINKKIDSNSNLSKRQASQLSAFYSPSMRYSLKRNSPQIRISLSKSLRAI
jgi:hypothetical protein